LLAVIADDRDMYVLILRWHKGLGDLSVHLCPEVFILVKGNAANWATQRLEPSKRHLQFPKAILMNSVTTMQDGYLDCGLKQVLQANWTILSHSVLHTSMRAANLVWVTTPASVTVEVVLSATNSAYAALVAMKNLFQVAIIVPEIAFLAEVGREKLTADSTALRRWLYRQALLADDLLNLCSVYLMGIPTHILCLIVAMSTPESLSATRGDNATAAPVMATASSAAAV